MSGRKSSARRETDSPEHRCTLQTLAVGLPDRGATSPAAPELSHLDERYVCLTIKKKRKDKEIVTNRHPKWDQQSRDAHTNTKPPRNIGRADGEERTSIQHNWRINAAGKKSASDPCLLLFSNRSSYPVWCGRLARWWLFPKYTEEPEEEEEEVEREREKKVRWMRTDVGRTGERLRASSPRGGKTGREGGAARCVRRKGEEEEEVREEGRGL